jgi:hypothetical protein
VLPLLTVVWANFHSGYLAGIALLLVYVAGDAVDLALGRAGFLARDRRDVAMIVLVALGCTAAAALNPNGFRLMSYAVDTLRTPAFREHIAEWRPPDLWRPPYWAFATMVALTGIVLVFAPSWPTATEAMLAIGATGAALSSARHVPIFAIVVAPVIARYALMLLERTPHSRLVRPILVPSQRAGPIGAVVLMGAVALAPFWSAAKLRRNSEIVAQTYPVTAVDFLVGAGLVSEHGYNPYDWGGYLIWRGVPVFIDGRADVYGAPFFEYHLKTALGAPDWSRPLDENGCAWALVQRDGAEAAVLRASARWCERYDDAIARIFVRCNGSERDGQRSESEDPGDQSVSLRPVRSVLKGD